MKFRNGVYLLSIILVAGILVSCSARKLYTVESEVVDYTAYTSRGFFMTEASAVSFDYDAVGSILARVESGYIVNVTAQKRTTKDKIHGVNKEGVVSMYDGYKNATVYDALDEIYVKAKASGADGIINLKTEPIITYKNDIPSITGYVVRGMVIKKK